MSRQPSERPIKERPILFSGPMVRAILSGEKTQTRRAIKPQPTDADDQLHGGELSKRAPYDIEDYETGVTLGYGFSNDTGDGFGLVWRCPYGRPGDRLWVREAWTPDHSAFYPCFPYVYRADAGFDYERNEEGKVYSPEQDAWYPFRWRPSIHMPRAASRITLEVTGVRVERLQDITEEDAKREGTPSEIVPIDVSRMPSYPCDEIQGKFAALWESINGEGSWDVNPWVWVVEFKRVTEGTSHEGQLT